MPSPNQNSILLSRLPLELEQHIIVSWRKRNQQDATNVVFIIKLLPQHVSGIIMPIFRGTILYITAYGVLHWLCWLRLSGVGLRAVCTVWSLLFDHSQHNQCRTPYAVIYSTVLLKMGIMMPETCWDKSLIINTRLVASCWFLFL